MGNERMFGQDFTCLWAATWVGAVAVSVASISSADAASVVAAVVACAPHTYLSVVAVVDSNAADSCCKKWAGPRSQHGT